jgi:hypothetical protein
MNGNLRTQIKERMWFMISGRGRRKNPIKGKAEDLGGIRGWGKALHKPGGGGEGSFLSKHGLHGLHKILELRERRIKHGY